MKEDRKIYVYEMLKYSFKRYITAILCLVVSCCVVFAYCNKDSVSADDTNIPEKLELTQTDIYAIDNMVTIRSLYNTATYYYYNGVLNRISALAVPKIIYSIK